MRFVIIVNAARKSEAGVTDVRLVGAVGLGSAAR